MRSSCSNHSGCCTIRGHLSWRAGSVGWKVVVLVLRYLREFRDDVPRGDESGVAVEQIAKDFHVHTSTVRNSFYAPRSATHILGASRLVSRGLRSRLFGEGFLIRLTPRYRPNRVANLGSRAFDRGAGILGSRRCHPRRYQSRETLLWPGRRIRPQNARRPRPLQIPMHRSS